MENRETSAALAVVVLPSKQVFALALLSLAVGLGIGYVLRGADLNAPAPPKAVAGMPVSPHGNAANGHMPTLEEMKQMADKQAAPLKEKLKSDPKNAEILAQVGGLYHSAHQYKAAADYFGKAVEADPKNVKLRTQLAVSLYREGDADGAMAQLNGVLKIDGKNADALFDLGLIRMEAKQDARGATAAWQQLLKTNPDLSAERKAVVEQMLAKAKAGGEKKGAEGNGAHR